jgi:hypothetical protein
MATFIKAQNTLRVHSDIRIYEYLYDVGTEENPGEYS